MAIVLHQKTDTFEVVVSADSALDMNEEEFEEYISTLNKDLLKFKLGEEPTIFVMRKVLPFSVAKKIQNEQVGMQDGKMEMRLGFIPEEVRASLIDIKNPASVPEDKQLKFKRASDGCASEELIELLISAGIVQELYRARQVAIGTHSNALKKK